MNYVLITPAKNEEPYIEQTIGSVIAQTLRPLRWIVVDDGSTDDTAAIVRRYLPAHDFIRLLTIQRITERDFGSKVAAFNAGLKLLKHLTYSLIGNLDADISVEPVYYESIIAEFHKDSRLGIAGGVVYTKYGRGFVTGDTAPDSVGGAVQLFRKECFEQVGGYTQLEQGGIDAAAEIVARMRGWTVRKFPEHRVWEHRRTGSAGQGPLLAMYKAGMRFHSLGYGTLFYISRSIYKLTTRPFVIGSVLALLGFISAKLKKCPVLLPQDVVAYLRSEQLRKLKSIFLR